MKTMAAGSTTHMDAVEMYHDSNKRFIYLQSMNSNPDSSCGSSSSSPMNVS